MDLDALLLFADVVETGSLSGAARMRHQTRSVVSKRLGKLEESLGARLLNRTTRSLSLTEVGQAVYKQAMGLRGYLEETHNLVDSLTARPGGTLRVTSARHFGLSVLQPLTAQFLTKYPEIGLDLVLSDAPEDMVARGYDLAIRITDPEDSSLVVRKLADNPVVLAASKSYLARRGNPATMDDLLNHDTIVYAATQVIVDHWRYREGDEVKTIQVQPRLKINDGLSMLQAVRDGLGIALLPRFLFTQEETDSLEFVLPHVALEPYAPVYLVYPARQHLPPKTRMFIEFLVEGTAAWRN